MFRFIWNSWWRNKERFVLLIVGALIVSIGLSYLVGITQASNATIVDELKQRWKSSYHIVVRPKDTRSVTEDKNLLEPNYLSGLSSGISLEQYDQIKSMEEIDVAAPIAMIGYMQNWVELNRKDYTEPGIYRMTITEKTNTGVEPDVEEDAIYFTVGWEDPSGGRDYGVTSFNGVFSYGTEVLIAGIDPESEAKLVGLNQAIINDANNHYLSDDDKPIVKKTALGVQETEIPVLLSNQEFVDGVINFTIEKLTIGEKNEPLAEVMETVRKQGGSAFLDKQSGIQLDEFTYTTKEVHDHLVEQISSGNDINNTSRWVAFKPSSVKYREVTSPFAERWPFAYEVEPYMVPEDSLLAVEHAYRPITLFGEDSSAWPRLQLDFKGIFDPSKLNISKDPLTELPMETYFPSKAKWVLNKKEEPVNPPTTMKPLNNPYGFLTKPPLMLTTIESAAEILGEKPISAIRLKVKGVEELNEESEQILQAVASEIEKTTGLITDITLGSSPQPALTHIPGIGSQESIGWVEQPWIKLGSSITIFKESKVGLSGVVASVIAVAIVYVFSSTLIMMYARKKEFAVLLAVGWRPKQLTRLLFMESALIGLFVSLMSWLILGIMYMIHDVPTSAWRMLLIGVFGISIYLLGSLIPGLLVRKISPYETMKAGEVARPKRYYFPTRSIFSMSFKSFVARWRRGILSILSIALPTGLLIFFLHVTFQLRGTMYTTWLGEYIALEVSAMHYIAMGVALAIAILTTAEIIWQNVAERQPEIAVLKAVGWQNRTIRKMVLMEGAFNGLLAGLLGLMLAIGMIWVMYRKFPIEQLPFLSISLLIPVLTGMIGAIIPSQKAARIQPYQGLSGGYNSSKKTEKRFQYVLGILGISLIAGILVVLNQAIPEIQETRKEPSNDNLPITKTIGEAREVVSLEQKEKAEPSTNTEEEKESFQSIIKNARRVYSLGKTYTYLEWTFKIDLAEDIDNRMETENEDLKRITIIVEASRKEEPIPSFAYYQPHITYKLVDEHGNEYDTVESEILESENYKRKLELGSPGKLTMSLTYEVPASSDRLLLKGFHDFWAESGFMVVDITGNVIE
jgi:hypothetical protein